LTQQRHWSAPGHHRDVLAPGRGQRCSPRRAHRPGPAAATLPVVVGKSQGLGLSHLRRRYGWADANVTPRGPELAGLADVAHRARSWRLRVGHLGRRRSRLRWGSRVAASPQRFGGSVRQPRARRSWKRTSASKC